MVPTTRRRLLHSGAAALCAGLAGCSDSTSETADVPSDRGTTVTDPG